MNVTSGPANENAGSGAILDFARNPEAEFRGDLCNLLHGPKRGLQRHATGCLRRGPRHAECSARAVRRILQHVSYV